MIRKERRKRKEGGVEEEIDFKSIEKKWQEEWEKNKIFEVKGAREKKKYYVLEMFPYPSASGLHMGHALNYTIGDIYSRFMRMQGFNVLYPMGFDSLGLPAENAAIKAGKNPRGYTEKAIKNFIKQMKELGLSYDWSRVIETHKPEYYKWDQWIFLKMYEQGLAYRKKAPVNYCPKCKTVLANEQVHNGKCWRHKDTDVEIRQLEQWFLKITEYADELYKGIDKLKGWPEIIKKLQKNWIGKSHGTEILFEVIKPEGKKESWKIFTTRPDTIFGVTFMVISAQHPKLMELVTKEQEEKVKKFLKKIKSVSEKEMEELEKEGVFTGSYAINPVNKEKIPIYAGNFVVADYGSGMVMAVPAHDSRDWEFAKKYNLKIKEVISGGNVKERAFIGEGVLINSGQFSGMKSERARIEISKFLEKKKLGKRTTEFRLKDWLISRQRYWGTPIPVVYCEKCGVVPVNEKDLPVELPEKVKFGEGNPLETAKNWVWVKCSKCGWKARRETDTMDTFVNSSWYYLRYTDPKNNKEIFDKKKSEYWMPVDQYIGGAEHACMHLIYSRFYYKFLRDLGMVKGDEPFVNLFNQGLLHGEDGVVMSKSRGNVVLPEEVSEKYGIDTARLFLVSQASPDKDISWDENGIEGSLRFIKRVFDFVVNFESGKTSELVESKLNKAIKEITEDIKNFRYNLAVIKLREFFDNIPEEEISKKDFGTFLKLLSPFCPHIAEELWHKLGNKTFISLESWPKDGKINEKLLKEEKQIERIVVDIRNILKILEGRGEGGRVVKIFAIPSEISLYEKGKEKIEKKTGLEVKVLSIKDAKKFGEKVVKAKQGKPGILIG